MKVEIKLEPELAEPYAQIHTAEITEQIQETIKFLGGIGQKKILTGYKDKKIFIINPQDIVCFYCEGQSVFARTSADRFTVRARLYELEEQFAGTNLTHTSFVRISSSAIANVDFIDSLEMNFNGTMRVQFKDGSFEYASRRYVSKLKKFFDI